MTETSIMTHAELTDRLAEVEQERDELLAAQAQQGEGEPVAFAFNDSLTGELVDFSCTQHSTGMTSLYTHPQPAQQMPERWKIEKHPDGISVYLPSNRGGIHLTDGPHNSIAHDVLCELCAAPLTNQEDK